MPADSLLTFADRTRTRLEQYPPQSSSETRAIVDSLLRALEWDPYVDTRTDVTVDGAFLEYVCLVDDVPALIVAVEATPDDLEDERLDALARVLRTTGIDRAIYTNGRDVLLLAGTDAIERYTGSLLANTTLEYLEELYGKPAVETYLGHHSRRDVARKLALERASLEAALIRQLLDVTGDSYRREISDAVTQLLDHLLESFAASQRAEDHLEYRDSSMGSETAERTAGIQEGERTDRGPSAASNDSSQSDGADTGDESDPTAGMSTVEFDDDETDSVSPTDAGEQETNHATDAESEEQEPESEDEPKAKASETEYVARFFSDRGSIGAVGHSDSAETFAHAAEFLFERGLSGIRLPWSPDAQDSTEQDEDTEAELVIVDREDTTRLTDHRTLSNGTHINTSGTATDHARRLEALSARAGYRVMLTGDWPS